MKDYIRTLVRGTWKVIPGFPDYEASTTGLLRRRTPARGTTAGKLIGKNISPSGYRRACLVKNGGRKIYSVHYLIAITFIGESPGSNYEIRHRDGDKLNNRPANLAWGTRSDNEKDKILHGRTNRGERHGMSKLTASNVLTIRSLRQQGNSHKSIAQNYNVTRECVRDICNFKLWGWLR